MDILKVLEVNVDQIKDFMKLSSYRRAKISGLSQSTWSRWISGERSPTLETINEIAPLFGMGSLELAIALMTLREEETRFESLAVALAQGK